MGDKSFLDLEEKIVDLLATYKVQCEERDLDYRDQINELIDRSEEE